MHLDEKAMKRQTIIMTTMNRKTYNRYEDIVAVTGSRRLETQIFRRDI